MIRGTSADVNDQSSVTAEEQADGDEHRQREKVGRVEGQPVGPRPPGTLPRPRGPGPRTNGRDDAPDARCRRRSAPPDAAASRARELDRDEDVAFDRGAETTPRISGGRGQRRRFMTQPSTPKARSAKRSPQFRDPP